MKRCRPFTTTVDITLDFQTKTTAEKRGFTAVNSNPSGTLDARGLLARQQQGTLE